MSGCSFCPECGQRIAPTPLRTKEQLVALLFTTGSRYVIVNEPFGDVIGVFAGVTRDTGSGKDFMVDLWVDDNLKRFHVRLA